MEGVLGAGTGLCSEVTGGVQGGLWSTIVHVQMFCGNCGEICVSWVCTKGYT